MNPEAIAKLLGLTGKEEEPPPPSMAEAALEVADNAQLLREMVQAQRTKWLEEGCPESVSWRMAADMWAALWLGASRG